MDELSPDEIRDNQNEYVGKELDEKLILDRKIEDNIKQVKHLLLVSEETEDIAITLLDKHLTIKQDTQEIYLHSDDIEVLIAALKKIKKAK